MVAFTTQSTYFVNISLESSISPRYFISSGLATSTPLNVMERRAGSDLLLLKGMMADLDGLMLNPTLPHHLFARVSTLRIKSERALKFASCY